MPSFIKTTTEEKTTEVSSIKDVALFGASVESPTKKKLFKLATIHDIAEEISHDNIDQNNEDDIMAQIQLAEEASEVLPCGQNLQFKADK